MAVRAYHVALGDLRKDRLPASVGERLTDLERLVAVMIEIQHHRVRLSAIATRVRFEVVEKPGGAL
jgi:hypothetical protein